MERNEAFVFLSLSITGQAGTRKWLFNLQVGMQAGLPANLQIGHFWHLTGAR